MRSASIGAIALVATAALAAEEARIVTVDGRASVSIVPDSAALDMAVQIRDRDMQVARQKVIEVTRDLVAFAARTGIDAAKIQTASVTIRPEYRWNPDNNRQELQGYLVQRSIVIELDELNKLGELIEGAVDVGVNQVSPPRLKHTRERDLRRDALAAAARDAEANAERLAETLGMRLGPARDITAIETPVPQPVFREQRMMAATADAGGADTYSTGEIRFEARVTARFDLVANE